MVTSLVFSKCKGSLSITFIALLKLELKLKLKLKLELELKLKQSAVQRETNSRSTAD